MNGWRCGDGSLGLKGKAWKREVEEEEQRCRGVSLFLCLYLSFPDLELWKWELWCWFMGWAMRRCVLWFCERATWFWLTMVGCDHWLCVAFRDAHFEGFCFCFLEVVSIDRGVVRQIGFWNISRLNSDFPPIIHAIDWALSCTVYVWYSW